MQNNKTTVTTSQPNKVCKEHKLFYGQIKKAESSFLGRYLAARHLPLAAQENHRAVMDKVDPDKKIPADQPVLWGDDYKKYRNAAYDYVIPSTARAASGNTLTSGLWGALSGGILGAGVGGRIAAHDMKDFDTGALLHGAGLGGAIGAGAGALLGAGNNLFQKWQTTKIKPEDIEEMKTRQKDRGYRSEYLPFRDLYDAAK